MKYIALTALLMLSACAHTVDVEETTEYKCGDKIVTAEFLDDDSVVVKIDGQTSVLNKVKSENGRRYDSTDSKISLSQDGSDTYLSINAVNYPLCAEIER